MWTTLQVHIFANHPAQKHEEALKEFVNNLGYILSLSPVLLYQNTIRRTSHPPFNVTLPGLLTWLLTSGG